MTEAKTEQAKREIAEENPLYSAWGPTAMASSISMWRDALVAERARNLELRERLKDLQEELRDSARSAAEESNRERWRREETEI